MYRTLWTALLGVLLGASILYGLGASTVSAQANLPPDWQDWDPELVGRYENDPRELQNLYSGSQELKNADPSNPTPTREYKRYGDQQTARTVWKRAVESKAGSVLRAGGRVLGPASWLFFGYTLIKGDPSGCTTDIGKIIQTDPPVCAMGMPIDTSSSGATDPNNVPFEIESFGSPGTPQCTRWLIQGTFNHNGTTGGTYTFTVEKFGPRMNSGTMICDTSNPASTFFIGPAPPTSGNGTSLNEVNSGSTRNFTANPGGTLWLKGGGATASEGWFNAGIVGGEPEVQETEVVEVGPMSAPSADPPDGGPEIPPNEMRDLYDFMRAQPEYTPYPADPDEQNDRWGAPVRSWENSDGSISTQYADGTIVTRWPDGTMYIKYPDGSVEWVRAKAPANGVQQNPQTIPFPNPGVSPNPYPEPNPYPGVMPVPHPSPAPWPAPTPPITPPSPPGEEVPGGPTDPTTPGCECDPNALIRPTVKYEEKFPFSLALYVRDLFEHASSASKTPPVFNLGVVGEVDMSQAHGTVQLIRPIIAVMFAALICWVMYKIISARKV